MQDDGKQQSGASLSTSAAGDANARSAHNRGGEMRHHGAAELRGMNAPRSHFFEDGFFGRMFSLPPFNADPAKLRQLGDAGGPMDPGPDAANNPDNPAGLAAGFTFLGQFIDHDITFDPTSILERQTDPEAIANFRTPALELDNMYGSGPGASPHLYQQADSAKLLISADGIDLPRNREGTALLGDPRNDENVIVSQVHLAFIKFHNAVVDRVRANPVPGRSVFEVAQEKVRWHYQWIVLNEFLPKTVGDAIVKDVVKNGRKFYKWRNDPFIPVEFAVAAYRFGHSQVRAAYRINLTIPAGLPIFAGRPAVPPAPRIDLSGGRPLVAADVVDMTRFFDVTAAGAAIKGKAIDTKISSPLLDLPMFSGTPDNPRSLATRNLLRHLTFGLPSGQAVAKKMKETPLTPAELVKVQPLGFDVETPLWYYILAEAEVKGGSKTLGPVGGRIVAEVLYGLLEGDRMSFLRQNPEWQPDLGPKAGKFTMADLLKVAGVVA
jgi:hypothetical protein